MSEASELSELPTNTPSPQVQPATSLDLKNPTKPQKRRRKESLPITINKHHFLYFPDGDIVLMSFPNENNIVTAFKIDRVFLVRASPVFEGMVKLPLSQNAEMFDSVPSVRLQDKSEHLEKFLNALYDSRCIPWNIHDPNTVSLVEGILLLATKYQVDHLRERIVGLLERDWPSTLSGWDRNEGEISHIMETEGEFSVDSLIPEPCEAIRLARVCGVHSLLPAAFYHLSRLRGTTDRRLLAPQQDSQTLQVIEGKRTADFSLLSAEDFRCLFVGRDALSDVYEKYISEAIKAARGSCKSASPKGCSAHLKEQVKLQMLHERDPLFWMKDGRTDFKRPSQTCQSCREMFFNTLEEKRQDLWEQLPTLFLLKSTS